jgi:hypothetical protein
VECALCHLSGNQYATLLPRGILWSEYRAMHEEQKQAAVAERLAECFSIFHIQ